MLMWGVQPFARLVLSSQNICQKWLFTIDLSNIGSHRDGVRVYPHNIQFIHVKFEKKNITRNEWEMSREWMKETENILKKKGKWFNFFLTHLKWCESRMGQSECENTVSCLRDHENNSFPNFNRLQMNYPLIIYMNVMRCTNAPACTCNHESVYSIAVEVEQLAATESESINSSTRKCNRFIFDVCCYWLWAMLVHRGCPFYCTLTRLVYLRNIHLPFLLYAVRVTQNHFVSPSIARSFFLRFASS